MSSKVVSLTLAILFENELSFLFTFVLSSTSIFSSFACIRGDRKLTAPPLAIDHAITVKIIFKSIPLFLGIISRPVDNIHKRNQNRRRSDRRWVQTSSLISFPSDKINVIRMTCSN